MLAWLRGKGRVDNTIAPAEPGVHARAVADREDEIADIDAQTWEAWRRGEKMLVDRLLDMRLGVRPPRPAPRVRPSVPATPGRQP